MAVQLFVLLLSLSSASRLLKADMSSRPMSVDDDQTDALAAREAKRSRSAVGSGSSLAEFEAMQALPDVALTDRAADAHNPGDAAEALVLAEERAAWSFADLSKGLGFTRDVVSVGRKGSEIGFSIADTATRFGFGIARGVLSGIGKTGDMIGIVGLGTAMRATDAVVGGAQTITDASVGLAKGITMASLDVTAAGLDAMGAEKYALARRVLGEDETHACIHIAEVVKTLRRDSGVFQQESIPDLAVGFARCGFEPRRATGSVPGTVLATMDASFLAPWMWLAAAVYGKGMNHALGIFRELQVQPNEFLAAVASRRGCTLLLDLPTGIHGDMFRPAAAVFADDAHAAVVLAIRGTSNIRDVLVDLVCNPLPLEPGELNVGEVDARFVHEGMWRAAQRLKAEVEAAVLAALAERPGYKLVVTGHSLGAGVASLLALIWKPQLASLCDVVAYAFAPPQTLDPHAATAAADQGVTALIVHDDVVPRLSLFSATALVGKAVRLGSEEGARESLSSAVFPVPTSSSALASLTTVAPEPSSVPAMRPAGRLVYLSLGADPAQAKVVENSEFHDIQVSKTFLSSHLQVAYLRALSEIGASASSSL